jgi:hypothetical protein
MTSRWYSAMSDQQLADTFVKLSIDEADAIGLGNVHAVNKLFNQLRAIERALRARGPQARKVLAPLLKYSAAPPPFSKIAPHRFVLTPRGSCSRSCLKKRDQRSRTLPRTVPATRADARGCACSCCKTGCSNRCELRRRVAHWLRGLPLPVCGSRCCMMLEY